MARTWSVPQRGNFAGSADFEWHPAALRKRRAEAAGVRNAQRGPLLLISALLTIIGVAVLNIDSQSLATLLLVAGAGLAAAVIVFSGEPDVESVATSFKGALSQRNRSACFETSSKFSELLTPPSLDPVIDRAVWAKLTAHMSHELRTPLNAVLGFSELMSNEVFGPLGSSCYGDYARDIHASGRMLLKSAEDALAITALLTSPERKGPPRSCGLRAVLDDAQAFAQPDLDARLIGVEADIGSDTEILCDPQAARQMLINLMAEVLRSAGDSAKVQINAHSEDDAIVFSVEADNVGLNTNDDDGFPLILARTLGELSGARVTALDTPRGGRRWTVRFLAPIQSDLFAKHA
ncbi:HAMP domain-containing sensor histidine kinase [Hyphomicrobium sp.]|jgi:two-component system cell cycle sensor histidine kinase PleC|uniref:sensor histidine kinase n=1 Tax=Hyphomicrobium sp. TaxID=82 RepID=UPI002C1E513C|nr:HAMP domain-containing sensor histidine kinase [Hyphomicrobium sp.]HVZ05160.1 HAMP domain-containing sensor histidine kinase [Hyphomicrobium sp.]